jgi:uncharacterized protein (DUF2141 family)
MHKTLLRVFLVAALVSPFSVLLPNVAFASLALSPAPCAVVGAPFLNITQNITNDPDSGVHGNWATDAFTEHVSVWLGSNNTTYCANANTTNGTFVTTGPLSPEAGVALSAGITGTFTGGENYTLPFATSSSITGTTATPQTLNLPDSSTAGFSTWVSTVFPSVAVGDGSNSVNTYSLTYITPSNGTWTDADGSVGVGSGGDTGDITGAPVLGTLSAQDFGVVNYDTGLGILKGYTAGFGVTDATLAGATSVVVKLYAAGNVLLQTNTAILPKFNTDITGTQFSSPFDVSGTFNYATDGYWTNVRESQFGQSVPAVKVVATVTLANGKVVTAENDLVTGDPTTIFPPITPVCNVNATASIVSDTTTTDTTDGHAAVAVTPNAAWTSIGGATWVYDAALNANGSSPTGTKVFTRTFNIVGTPSDSSLVIAADNMYTVNVNGHLINTGTSGADLDNFSSVDTWTIPAADLLSGANTITFTVNNAATNPATNAPFGDPNPGGLLYKLTVNNNECVTPTPTGTASISGSKFEDWDGDSSPFETQWEVGLKGWVIYLDTNGNGALDSGEISTTTDKHGAYKFSNLPAGTYTVREVQQVGWTQTYPSTNAANDQYSFTLSAGQKVTKKDFGNFKLGSISGMKFEDKNGNHKKDGNESGLSGWTINLTGPNGYASTTVTDANGNYTFSGLKAGTYKISEVMKSGWKQTDHPGQVKITSAKAAVKKNFGNKMISTGNKTVDKDDGKNIEDDD